MALPVILLAASALAGTAGVANAAKGAQKMAETNADKKEINSQHEENTANYEIRFSVATQAMDTLGEKEINVLADFNEFSDVIERIENRPEFGSIVQDGFKLPDLSLKEIKDVSVGAVALAGGMGGVAAGTFGGFAAASATTSAVMAIGTASTGTAIASLSGAAATNATLAALGGGALAAGGGGIALGTTVLGAATAGIGIMVGGIIFNITGNSVKAKMEEAKEAVEEETFIVNKVCAYLEDLTNAATNYHKAISLVKKIYDKHFARLQYAVVVDGKTDYTKFDETDKLAYSNTVLLVGILYDMLKVNVVNKIDENFNEVNAGELNRAMKDADKFLSTDPFTTAESRSVLTDDVITEVIDFSVYDVEPEPEEEKESITDKLGKGVAEAQSKVEEGMEKVTPKLKEGAMKASAAAGYAAGYAAESIRIGASKLKDKIDASKKDK